MNKNYIKQLCVLSYETKYGAAFDRPAYRRQTQADSLLLC